MGAPAAVQGDRITGVCTHHSIPGGSGNPQPVPAMDFSAPLTKGLAASVEIMGKPAAVQGSSGYNTPPHKPSLHPSDPYATPQSQEGKVAGGAPTVEFEGRPAASAAAQVHMCRLPGQLAATATTVEIG